MFAGHKYQDQFVEVRICIGEWEVSETQRLTANWVGEVILPLAHLLEIAKEKDKENFIAWGWGGDVRLGPKFMRAPATGGYCVLMS